MTYFTKINYAFANEDGASELAALELGPTDTALCLTGSGARALDLLIAGPRRVTSIDLNPAQTHLLELKTAAYRLLEYPQLLAFFGLAECEDRGAVYRRLRGQLSTAAAAFWDRRGRAIAGGVCFCGSWERWIRALARLGWPRRRVLRRLYEAPDREAQARIWRDQWDGALWRGTLWLIARRWIWRHVFREPGIEAVPAELEIFQAMRERFEHLAREVLIRDAFFPQMLFFGRVLNPAALPLHLQEKNAALIKERLDRLEPVTADLIDFLEGTPRSFDAFSLSDFSSYTRPHQYDRVWRSVLRRLAPGGRACERRFLVRLDPTERPALAPWMAGVSRRPALEAELDRSDRSFIYRFGCFIKG